MQPQPAEAKTPPNVLQFGRAREPFAPSSVQTASEPGLEIHEHELVRRVGRGAYGEVWLARNALGTMRAIKIVYRKDFEDSRPFEREFAGIQKFEPISRSHPGLVNILQIGRREDYFYYVMELADAAEDPKPETRNPNEGRKPKSESTAPSEVTLRSAFPPPSARDLRASDLYRPRTLREDLRQNGRLPAERCVEIGLALASALAHLHRQGLVHRDVKPSNIIFVQGVPQLADIGLVTEAGDSRSIVGTEGYLPPEGPGTPQADIFSLGKVLYEISTGQDRHQFPDLPPDLKDWPNAGLVFELNQAILKACATAARERYQSAEEMRGELALLRRGGSVRRRRDWEQRIRAVRGIGFSATVVVVAAAGSVFLWQTIERSGPPILSPINQDAAGTQNANAAKAYQLGLPGMRRGTPEGFRQALMHFTAATEADPKSVNAYARLFETYLMSEDHGLAMIDRKTAKLNAFSARLAEIAPTNAQTHAAIAIVRFLNDWKWGEAEAEFKQALKSDPSCRMALTYYGYLLTRLGRASEARYFLEHAQKLDLTSPLIKKFLGHCEFVQRHYEKALPFYLDASETEPSYPSGHYWAGRAYWAMKNYDQALEEFEKQELLQGLDRPGVERRYRSYREALEKAGPRGYWTKLIETANEQGVYLRTPYKEAERYARLGDRPRALASLEEALRQRDSVESLLVDEFWDDFRDEPKFREMEERIGLNPEKR